MSVTPESFLANFDPEHSLFAEPHQRFTAASRLFEKVAFTGDCWEWLGGTDGKGYGVLNSKTWQAWFGTTLVHRQFYMAFVNPDLEKYSPLDHLCANKMCVRPEHLDNVTQAENTRRGVGLKETCVHGHPYTPENRIKSNGSDRATRCRLCHREYEKKRREAIARTPTHLKE